jgi:hypothetical protein
MSNNNVVKFPPRGRRYRKALANIQSPAVAAFIKAFSEEHPTLLPEVLEWPDFTEEHLQSEIVDELLLEIVIGYYEGRQLGLTKTLHQAMVGFREKIIDRLGLEEDDELVFRSDFYIKKLENKANEINKF